MVCRLQKLEDKLEEVATPGAESIPPDVMKELSTHLDIVRCDLDASQECWTESMKRIKGEKKTCTGNSSVNFESTRDAR